MASHDKSTGTEIALAVDFESITRLFKSANEQGRDFLFEHETYELLKRSGAETPPRTNLLAKGSRPSDEVLTAIPGDKVVLKIVSPTIIHKTEVGGVRVVEKQPDKIRSAWRRMMAEVPENCTAMIQGNPAHAAENYRGLSAEQLQQAIARVIERIDQQ